MCDYRELRVQIEVASVRAAKAAADTLAGLKRVRRAAFVMATALLSIQADHVDEFREEVKARYGAAKDGVNRWIEDEFKPLIAVGEDPYSLLRSIRDDGLTLPEYLNTVVALPPNGKRVGPSAEAVTVPDAPPASEDLSPEQRNAMLRARCVALELQNRQLREQLQPLQRRVAHLERVLKRFNAIMKKAKEEQIA